MHTQLIACALFLSVAGCVTPSAKSSHSHTDSKISCTGDGCSVAASDCCDPADPSAAGPAMPATAPTAEPTVITPSDAVTYVCPMHPEVTNDKPSKCPKCGMALEPKAKGPDHAGH